MVQANNFVTVYNLIIDDKVEELVHYILSLGDDYNKISNILYTIRECQNKDKVASLIISKITSHKTFNKHTNIIAELKKFEIYYQDTKKDLDSLIDKYVVTDRSKLCLNVICYFRLSEGLVNHILKKNDKLKTSLLFMNDKITFSQKQIEKFNIAKLQAELYLTHKDIILIPEAKEIIKLMTL